MLDRPAVLLVVFSCMLSWTPRTATASDETTVVICETESGYVFSGSEALSTRATSETWYAEDSIRDPNKTLRIELDESDAWINGREVTLQTRNETSALMLDEHSVDLSSDHTMTIITYALNLATNKLVSSHVNTFLLTKDDRKGVNAGTRVYDCVIDANDGNPRTEETATLVP